MTDSPSVWRGRDFRLAWAGGLVNDTGDWVLMVGLPVYVFTETGSGTSTAIVFLCELVVAALFGALGGSLVDRWNLRRCLIATNLAQAAMLLPLLAVRPDRVWPAYVAVVGQALLTQLNNPANVALIPRVVSREQLTSANAALAASTSLARLVGAPLGGLLVAVSGLRAIVLVDLVSFLAVALAITFVRADTDPVAHADGDVDDPHPIRTGLKEINRRPVLRGVVAIGGISQIAQGGFVVLFVVFVVERLGRDGTEVGIIRGTMALGAVLGAALIARMASRVDPLRLIVAGFTGMGLVSLVFWNAPRLSDALWVYILLFALSGIPGSALSVGIVTTVQTRSPPAVLGRVVGVMRSVESIGQAGASILTGVLVDTVPLTALLDAQALVYVACGLLTLGLVRRHRSLTVPGALDPVLTTSYNKCSQSGVGSRRLAPRADSG
jgi:predicted MFS family arabinose efflux permease